MIKASLKAEAASTSVSSGGGPVIVSPHQAGARPRDVNAFGFGNVRTGQVIHCVTSKMYMKFPGEKTLTKLNPCLSFR